MLIDDFEKIHPLANNGARWQIFTDQVMGGVSRGTLTRESIAGRAAIRMRGNVCLEHNGGFVQMGLDLASDSGLLDAGLFEGVEMDVLGNGESYGVHLRTGDMTRPWQSYRQGFVATESWRTVRLPFDAFEPHRIGAPLDLRRLRRIGIAAIGRAFAADVALSRLCFYRAV